MTSEIQTGFTVAEVARRYRVSPDKIRAWIRSGQLVAINTASALCGKPRWVITPDALEAFEQGRKTSNQGKHKSPPRRCGKDYYPD